jgi:hypothetical protein
MQPTALQSAHWAAVVKRGKAFIAAICCKKCEESAKRTRIAAYVSKDTSSFGCVKPSLIQNKHTTKGLGHAEQPSFEQTGAIICTSVACLLRVSFIALKFDRKADARRPQSRGQTRCLQGEEVRADGGAEAGDQRSLRPLRHRWIGCVLFCGKKR